MHATLIEPIPYPDAEQIVFLGTQHPASGDRGAVSFPDFLSWETASNWFSQMAVMGHENVTMRGNEGAVRVVAETVSAGYFGVLGIAPDKGRVFLRSEATEIGGPNQVTIVSHAFWQDTLGGRESVLDADLEISGMKYRVIGPILRSRSSIGRRFPTSWSNRLLPLVFWPESRFFPVSSPPGLPPARIP